MRLSVIIPVYNVENTLDRCVESVLHQHVKGDMEVILVDDGSPDNSPLLCDNWAEKDDRIHVIHKQNGGLSDARNAGLDIAIGDYITFVDSDDWIEENTYEPLMSIMEEHPEYDMLEYSYERGDKTFTFGQRIYTAPDDYWLQGELYRHAFAWNKIYRRTLFANARYPKGRVFEDIYIMPQLTSIAKVMAVCDLGLYHYTQNENGITMSSKGGEVQLLLEGLITAIQHLRQQQDTAERQAFYLCMLDTQLEVFSKGGDILLTPYNGKLPMRRQYTWRCKIKILLYRMFGIKSLCIIYKILDRLVLHRS